jgi:hypothetical protein
LHLSECREAYRELSGLASERARTLALSGIAIIWVFATDSDNGPDVPNALFTPGAFLVTSLACDLLHYLFGSVMWGTFSRWKERHGTSEEDEFLAPGWINWPANVFYASKFVTVAIAYGLLLTYLVQKL